MNINTFISMIKDNISPYEHYYDICSIPDNEGRVSFSMFWLDNDNKIKGQVFHAKLDYYLNYDSTNKIASYVKNLNSDMFIKQ